MVVYSTVYRSPVGRYVLASDGENITGVWQEGQKYYMQGMPRDIIEKDDMPIFDAAKGWLDRYFAGQKPDLYELPLAPQGRLRWQARCEKPALYELSLEKPALHELSLARADVHISKNSCSKPAMYELPLAPQGSEFRQKVWNALCEIPYGETMTYGDIGRKIGCMSGQAVGGAVGHNPISIIIPCHRVIGSNGSLTGYAGGLETKRKLLELER